MPNLLDLFGGAGGAGEGYRRAGFAIIGIDITPHPDYPGEHHVMDWAEGLARFGDWADVIHASPPCPRYSVATPKAARDKHPDLVAPVREALQATGKSYVIENVPGSPLHDPALYCGSSFGLRVRRHRLFESNVHLDAPACSHHTQPSPVVGVYGNHPDRPGGWKRPDGTSRGVKATSVEDASDALGIYHMTTWSDLADSIPPAYTMHIGAQLIDHLGDPKPSDLLSLLDA